ncbi:MAG: DUF3050 domain-containing protein [Flavobacterium sp.]|nr:DUF3050 domain-containing protein [Flavobacterium sp.]
MEIIGISHPQQISTLKYFLEGYIGVDGNHHGTLTLKMVAELCGNHAAKWQAATKAAILAFSKATITVEGH